MPNIGVPELMLFFLILLLLFGANRLAGIGTAIGRSIRDFKKEMRDVEDTVSDDRPRRESRESPS